MKQINFFKKEYFFTIFIFVIVFSNSLQAQVIKAFSQRPASNTPSTLLYSIKGDYTMIGNTNITLASYGDFTNNSNNFMEYVDIDSDPNTFNSSSATLDFSTENGAIPQCSNILFAGLYWTGRASNNSSSSPEEFDVTIGATTKTFNKRKIQLKGPGASSYTEFEANPGNIFYPDGAYGNMYSAFVEVTDYIDTLGTGEYTVADMALVQGNGGGTGYYGGWGMIVVYENSKMNWRDVTIFDGHAYVQGNAVVNYELPVSGFNTAQSGPINMKLGVMAGEGDVGISGDYFKVRNWQDNAWVTLDHAGNSTNNFFNGSVNTGGNLRDPNLQNNTGLDIAMFDVPNPGNTVVTNGQTSTRFQYGSTQDTYVIFCIAMAVDAYIPDVESVVSTETINGIPAGGGALTVLPGEDIEYKVQIKNLGTEAVDSAVFVVPLPYTTSFVPASITTQVNFTPLPTPNTAYFDPLLGPTGSVVYEFGTLPLPPVGFPDSVLAELTFHLQVTSDCYTLTNPGCDPQVVLNGGTTTGIGAVSGLEFDMPFIQGYEEVGVCVGEPINDPLIINIDPTQHIIDNCSTTPSTREFLFCNYDDATIPFDSVAADFPAGVSFYNENNVTPSAIEYDENNPFPAIAGTNTYFAIPDGVNFCYYTFTITVQSPIITFAVQTSEVNCIGGNDGAIDLTILGGIAPFTYDWSGPGAYSESTEDISLLSAGLYDVTIYDSIGCTATASEMITTIVDIINPSFTFCAGNQTEASDAGVCTYTNLGSGWDPIATDNCSITSTNYVLSGVTTGTGTTLDNVIFNLGITTVTWTTTDDSGNTASCSYTVEIEDEELPTITSCGGAGVEATFIDPGSCVFTKTGSGWNATATDNCSLTSIEYALSGVTTGTGTSLDGVIFNLGVTTVTWTVTDGSGNMQTCAFDVDVIDNQIPLITTCGGTGTENVNVDAGVCDYTNIGVAWDAQATDNCSINTLSYLLSGATTGTGTSLDGVTFNTGSTNVTWTATDIAGNIQTCTFDVEVIDNQFPSISTCGGVGTESVSADFGVCNYTNTGIGWDAQALDNCSVSTIEFTLSGATIGTGSTLNGITFNLGTTTVLWTVTDGSGNITTCTFDVNVIDDQFPVITKCGPSISQIVNADLADCSYTYSGTDWDAIAIDNCAVSSLTYTLSGATSGTGTSLNGVSFNLGATLVTWTVLDGSGNTATCSFQVTVLDDQLPSILSCGAVGTQNISTDPGVCNYTMSGTGWDASATDNCSITSLQYSLTGATLGSGSTLDGVTFAQGLTTVTWTAFDASGNSVACSFDVIVSDNEVPSISNCVSNIIVNNDLGDCGAIVTWTPPTFTDNCGATMTSTHSSGDFFSIGISTVTYTVTDGSGNVSNCMFSVEVNDNELPQINCPTNIESCDSLTIFPIPVASDNCGVVSVTQTSGLSSGSYFPVGTTIVTFEVLDVNGNINSCSFDVIIRPTPLINSFSTDVTCNGDGNGAINLTVSNGTLPYSYLWSNGASTEDLTGLQPGTYGVTVNDFFGCMSTDSYNISQPAQLQLSKNVTNVNCFDGIDGTIDITITGGTIPYAFDWGGGVINEDLNGIPFGLYSVIVTDDNGCQLTNSTTITQPDSLSIQTIVEASTCNAPNGSVSTLVTGGVSPYDYSWSNGNSNANLSNVVAGSYTLTVTDANNCISVQTDSVGTSSNLTGYIYSTEVLCYGGSSGTALAVIETGNAPYSYNWSIGDTTNLVNGLTAGYYSVFVQDAFGCEITLDFDLTQPDSLIIELYSPEPLPGFNVSLYGGADGSIQSSVFGGVEEYSYQWITGSTSENLYNLTTGSYSLIVTDANGCNASAQIGLSGPRELALPEGLTPNGDGDNDYFVIKGINAYPNNEITIYNRWGNVVYQQSGYNNDWQGGNMKGDDLPDGTYFVIFQPSSQAGVEPLTGYVDLRRSR